MSGASAPERDRHVMRTCITCERSTWSPCCLWCMLRCIGCGSCVYVLCHRRPASHRRQTLPEARVCLVGACVLSQFTMYACAHVLVCYIYRSLYLHSFLYLGKFAVSANALHVPFGRPRDARGSSCFNDFVLYMIRYAASRRDCMSNMSQGICCAWQRQWQWQR